MSGKVAKHRGQRICSAEYPKIYRVFFEGLTRNGAKLAPVCTCCDPHAFGKVNLQHVQPFTVSSVTNGG